MDGRGHARAVTPRFGFLRLANRLAFGRRGYVGDGFASVVLVYGFYVQVHGWRSGSWIDDEVVQVL